MPPHWLFHSSLSSLAKEASSLCGTLTAWQAPVHAEGLGCGGGCGLGTCTGLPSAWQAPVRQCTRKSGARGVCGGGQRGGCAQSWRAWRSRRAHRGRRRTGKCSQSLRRTGRQIMPNAMRCDAMRCDMMWCDTVGGSPLRAPSDSIRGGGGGGYGAWEKRRAGRGERIRSHRIA